MKRRFSLVLALLMLLSFMTACGGKKAEPVPAKAADTPAAPPKTYKVTMWQHTPFTRVAVPDKSQDFIRQYIEEKYGLDIQIVPAPADGADAKLNAMIAGGDLPDLIQARWNVANNQYRQFMEQGVLIPLDDYIKEFKYLQSVQDDFGWAHMKSNGKTFGVATRSGLNGDSLWIRKDWLERLSLKMPTTVEELATVAKAFATQDPDGNGKPDTYGFTAHGSPTDLVPRLETIMAPFGVYPGRNYAYVENNQVVFTAFSKEMKVAIQWLQDLVKAKAIDPDWMTNKFENWRNALIQGKVGIAHNRFELLREYSGSNTMGKEIKEANPKANWVQLPALKGPAGTFGNWAPAPTSISMHITRKGNDEPGKARAIMKFMADAMNPETETFNILAWGKKDVHYDMKDGKVWSRLPAALAPEAGWLGYYRVFRIPGDFVEDVFWRSEPALREAERIANNVPVLDKRRESIVPTHDAAPDFNAYIREMHAKFILGTEPMASWDKFTETAMTKYRGKEILDQHVAEFKKHGLIK